MKNVIAVIAAASLCACGGGGEAPDDAGESPSVAPISVFIFAGQSNMHGADALISPGTGVLDLVEVGEQTDADRSALFTMSGGPVRYEWGPIRGHGGTHLGELAIEGKPVKVHGPEVGFNRTLGGNVAIVKYATNFTNLEYGRSPWVKPGTRWTSWQTFVDQQLASIGKPYKIAGVVWFQGIDDGLMARDKAAYKADLVQMLADVRAKFGNVPVVLGQSIDTPNAAPGIMASIREAQREVGAMQGNGWISVDDLGPWVADHHMTAASQIISGQRFAAEYQRIQ